MIVPAHVTLQATRAALWATIADVEHAAQVLGGVEAIEIVDQPASGLTDLKGLRWRETRLLFDKPATVEKWVTEAAEGRFYKTRAESDGFVFLSTLSIEEEPGGALRLVSVHESIPQGFVSTWVKHPMVFLFKGVARKALLQDLNDYKAAVESRSG